MSPLCTHQYLHVKKGFIRARESTGIYNYGFLLSLARLYINISSTVMIPLKCILTCTIDSISFKSTVASTFIVANDISAGSVHMTAVNLQYTLIYVCWKSHISQKVMPQKSTKYRIPYPVLQCVTTSTSKVYIILWISFLSSNLTCTVYSISRKASIAGTLKATKGVNAGGIFMTVVCSFCTFTDVYTKQNNTHKC